MTRVQKECLDKYNKAVVRGYMNIKTCYKNPSKREQDIWHHIVMACHALNGNGLTVVTHNQHTFTAGFKYNKEGKEYLVYFAPSYTLDFEVPKNVKSN